MATTQELIFKITADNANLKATMAQVRSELGKTEQVQKTTHQGELSMQKQLAAAASLQRQRSAALIADWKRTESAAARLASGVQPVGTNLQRITDIMQTLGGTSATLQGPLGGVAGRLRSIGALATEAGGGLGIAGVATGALVVAAGALAIGLYKLTVAAAEFQGKMFDLSQQTGVGVETLSTLDVIAQQTGGNIDAIAQSLGVFQSHLEAALDPTSKEAALLQRLGVDATDTEGALRQTLTALSKMTVGFEQTTAARDLFGGRGAKAFLAILKETGGDIDGTTERLRKMGILISTEAAQAADKFNDQLIEVGLQIRGLTAIIGNEAMPAISKAAAEVSRFLTDNRGVFVGWSSDVADAARGAVIFAQALYQINNAVSGLKVLPPGYIEMLAKFSQEFSGLPGIFRELQKLGAGEGIPAISIPELAVPLRASDSQGTTIRGKKDKGKAQRDTALQNALRDAALTERETQQIIAANVTENKRALDEQVRDIEEFTKRAIALSLQRKNAIIDQANSEFLALDIALRKKSITQAEFDQKWREQNLEIEAARQKHSEEVWNLEHDRDRKKSEAELAARQRSDQIAEEADQRTIARIKSRIDQELIAEAAGERQIAEVLAGGFARRKEALEKEDAAYATSLERHQAIADDLIKLDGERAKSAEDAAQRIVDAINRERAAQFADQFERGHPDAGSEWADPGAIGKILEKQLGPPPEAFNGWAMLKSTALDAVGAMAGAVGQLTQAWVLYGNAGPNAMKKMVASVLAGVSAQAAVNAVMELAYGIAALTPWGAAVYGPAPFHFKSAALFGSIALVSGLAGRAVAGDAFNQSTGGGGGGGTGGGRTTPVKPPGIEVDRRSNLNSAPQRVEVVIKLANGAHQFIEGSVVENWNSNGRIRATVLNDGS